MKSALRISWLIAGVIVASAGAAEVAPSASPPESASSRLKLTFAAAAAAEKPAVDPSPAVLLPKFEVRDSQLKLSPRDVQTGAAIVAEAKARYLNPVYQKTGGQLMAVVELIANPLGGWNPNVATAMTFYAQDERLRHIKESNELIEVHKGDPAKYRELRELLFDTYQHGPNRRPGVLQRR